MGFVKKIFKYITDKNYRFTVNANLGRYDNMPDEEYIKKMFRAELGENLDQTLRGRITRSCSGLNFTTARTCIRPWSISTKSAISSPEE